MITSVCLANRVFVCMQHSLCFSEAQLRNICALRQVYLQTEALLKRQKRDTKYLLWCAEANLASVSAQSCEPTEAITAQLQLTDVQLQEALILYKTVLYDGVCQAHLCFCHSWLALLLKQQNACLPCSHCTS